MMAELVNLRNIRKRRERADREAAATANRAAFGRTKSEKSLTTAKRQKQSRQLDAHKRDE
jgi:Domain of unknown function (DUF4169)